MPLPAKGDTELLKLATSFVNLRIRDFSELTGRSEDALRRRLVKLLTTRRVKRGKARGEDKNGLGLFYRLPNPSNPFEKVYFPTQLAWDRALKHGFLKHEVNANREKSDDQLEHDLVLTDFHKALHFAFGERLTWSQLWRHRYTRWGKREEQYVNADAYFHIDKGDGDYPAFFVEVEMQKGVQEPMRKMSGYTAFASGHYQEKFGQENFRVIVLKPSAEMVDNLKSAAAKNKACNTRRFWLSDIASALKVTEAIYHAPPDTKRYSLLDA